MNERSTLKRRNCGLEVVGIVALVATIIVGAEWLRADEPPQTKYLCISGIYPHLAAFNQPEDVKDRPNHGEAGTGAIVPWAGKLWFLTYPQHKTTGSNDKLYAVDEQMNVEVRPESVGGTHACRMIHRESNQLIIGPYFIDAQGNVRVCDLHKLRGRMTAVMRHLTDPANKVYFYDMEGALYEVDVHSLDVVKLFAKPVPGWHGKGGYTAQGRVVIANNGERGNGNAAAYRYLKVGGPPQGEEAGVLAEWDGETWRIVERKQFTDVTGPGGIEGNPDDRAQLWAIGWDKRSVILKLLDGGTWYTYRLPKSSLTYDPEHGWYTEWPRIREITDGRWMLCMHGGLFDFPPSFSAHDTAGIRPIATQLRYIPDFCAWRGKVVLGADDASMMNNPLCGQAQSNLWFGTYEQMAAFGPDAGWGGVWLNDTVKAGEPSVPYLAAGYRDRTVHVVVDAEGAVRFRFEVDPTGKGDWQALTSLVVPPGEYRTMQLPDGDIGEWIRVVADRDCRATVFFHYWSPTPAWSASNADLFAALAEVDAEDVVGGIVRPASHNRSLQWLTTPNARAPESVVYQEVRLASDGSHFVFDDRAEDRTAEVLKIGEFRPEFEVDAASVIVKDSRGRRFRLPKGDAAFDQWIGKCRVVREVASERFLANVHGTFYEIPRAGDNTPDWRLAKPMCSHGKAIVDFCSWRGLLVLSGTQPGASSDGHFFADSQGRGLWFGALDDLWRLGKPHGNGGPWHETHVKAGTPSDPYMMTNFAYRALRLSHDADVPVRFTLQIDFDHHGFHDWTTLVVRPGEVLNYEFPKGFHAHWLRVVVDHDCVATAQCVDE